MLYVDQEKKDNPTAQAASALLDLLQDLSGIAPYGAVYPLDEARQMTLEDLIKLMGRLLEAERVSYFTFGAVAMNFWVPPRTTNDLDIVACVGRRAVPQLIRKLNEVGFQITTSLQRKLTEGRIIKLKISATELDVKLCVTRHDMAALRRSQLFVKEPFTLRVATAEDVVLYKLQSWRLQDQADVERIVKSYKSLDVKYIEGWLGRIEDDTGYPVSNRWESMV